MSKRPKFDGSPQSKGAISRARKLSPARRKEIALMGARASMKKAGREFALRKSDTERAYEEHAAKFQAEAKSAQAIMLDPVAWIEEYLVNPATGKPFVLYEAQKVFLREAFAPDPTTLKLKYDEVIFSAPKKSGKSGLASMILLYVIGVLGGDRAEGYIASNSREQSNDRIFADCTAILKASKSLADFANATNDQVQFPSTGGFIKTVTTEATSAAGGRPTLVVFDELWGFQARGGQRLWDELVITPTVPISVRLTVTYAGFSGESTILEGLYRNIFDESDNLQPGVEEIAPDLYRKGGMLMYWTHDNMRAPWQTPKWVQSMREAYANRPNQFARIIENRWVSSESTFIEANVYDRCVDKTLRPVRQSPRLHVWAAVDASVRKDSTAIVTVALDAQEVSEVKTMLDQLRTAREPHANPLLDMMAAIPWKQDFDDAPRPLTLDDLRIKVVAHKILQAGTQVDFSEIERYVLDLTRRFHVELVAYDPYQMISVAQGLTRLGVPMYELAQTAARTMEFSGLLRDLLGQQRLRIYPDAEVRQQVLNAIAKETNRGWHIVKRTKSAKIDVAVALAMACYGCARGFGTDPDPVQVDVPVGDIFAV